MAVAMGTADVSKPWQSRFIELGEVIWLLPGFCQTEKIELTVRKEILDEMTLARKRANVEQTKVDCGIAVLDSCISQPS